MPGSVLRFARLHAGAIAPSWERRAVDRSVSQLHTLAWVELTASGRPGVLTGKRVRAHEGADPGSGGPTGLWFYERRAADGAWTRRALGGTEGVVGTGLQIRTADLDGDGRLDVAVSGKTGTFVLFQRSPPR